MNILSFTAVEVYLANRQIYFRREICNSDFKTIALGGRVHNIGNVAAYRVDERTVQLEIQIDGESTVITQYCSDLAFFAWVKTQFVPLSELASYYYCHNNS